MLDGEKEKPENDKIYGENMEALLAIMQALRAPNTGCPWDQEQDFSTIAPYTIEEAYEVADAIDRNDFEDLCEELGDLLLQVVYHAQMAEEIDKFSYSQVVGGICRKMIRRHPHVFGSDEQRRSGQVKGMWEDIKAKEKQAKLKKHDDTKHDDTKHGGALSGVPENLPPLTRAIKLQEKAARVGFDWKDPAPVFSKVSEELEEVRVEMNANRASKALEEEVGDLLFAVTNLARHLEINPEVALRSANHKFNRRFGKMEQAIIHSGHKLEDTSLQHMENVWQQMKKQT